jgi:hypothetical protein
MLATGPDEGVEMAVVMVTGLYIIVPTFKVLIV